MLRLLVFDADDTLRRTLVPGQPCPHGPDEWALLPGVRERLAHVRVERLRVGVASNQDHVGYGLVDAGTAERLLRDALIAATGGRVTDPAVAFCPHPSERGCECRKPRPGLLRRLMSRTGAAAHETLFVGDAEPDRLAAEAAGTHFVWAWDYFCTPIGDSRRRR